MVDWDVHHLARPAKAFFDEPLIDLNRHMKGPETMRATAVHLVAVGAVVDEGGEATDDRVDRGERGRLTHVRVGE